MNTLKISLGIARLQSGGSDSSPDKKKSSKKLPKGLKDKILERDNHTCKGCGFQAKKYQEVLHLNSNTADVSENNLATTCIFCHQCFNLQDVNEMRSGALLWLPEISQADLHHMARAIYVARISQGPVAEAARLALDTLMTRREQAKERISTDDPYILSTVLSDYLGPKHYKARTKKLEGIRLFPLDRRIIKEADLEFNQFPQILAYWRSKAGPFGGKTPQQWIALYQDLQKAA